MEVTGQKGLGHILKNFLQICFYIGIVILLILPFVLNMFELRLGASMLIIYPNGIILLMIAHNFIKLFNSLKENNPFCEKNIKIFKKTGVIAFIGALFWLLDLAYEIILAKSFDIIFILAMLFLFILYFGVSIALYILSELFKQATEYKQENELTI